VHLANSCISFIPNEPSKCRIGKQANFTPTRLANVSTVGVKISSDDSVLLGNNSKVNGHPSHETKAVSVAIFRLYCNTNADNAENK